MTGRTIDLSDQWNDFRTNDPSDYRPVVLLTIRTNAWFSDQWNFGPMTIRNIEPSPYKQPFQYAVFIMNFVDGTPLP